MLNILFITVVLVFGIDLSGVVDSLSEWLWKKMYKKVPYNGWKIPKPFSCSLCSTFWVGIIYLLVTHTFSWFMLLYVALLAFMTPVISTTLILIKDSLIWLLNKLYELLK